MGVDLPGRQLGVTLHDLKEADVGAVFQHVAIVAEEMAGARLPSSAANT
jgi:hypothetical protein